MIHYEDADDRETQKELSLATNNAWALTAITYDQAQQEKKNN